MTKLAAAPFQKHLDELRQVGSVSLGVKREPVEDSVQNERLGRPAERASGFRVLAVCELDVEAAGQLVRFFQHDVLQRSDGRIVGAAANSPPTAAVSAPKTDGVRSFEATHHANARPDVTAKLFFFDIWLRLLVSRPNPLLRVPPTESIGKYVLWDQKPS